MRDEHLIIKYIPPPPLDQMHSEAGALERGWWYKWVGPAVGAIVRRLRRSPRDQM